MRLGNETQGMLRLLLLAWVWIWDGVACFMLHLENILALGDAVQRHAASEGISCQLWLRFVMLTMLKCVVSSFPPHSRSHPSMALPPWRRWSQRSEWKNRRLKDAFWLHSHSHSQSHTITHRIVGPRIFHSKLWGWQAQKDPMHSAGRQDVAFNVDNLPPHLRFSLKPDSVGSSTKQRLNWKKLAEMLAKTNCVYPLWLYGYIKAEDLQ